MYSVVTFVKVLFIFYGAICLVVVVAGRNLAVRNSVAPVTEFWITLDQRATMVSPHKMRPINDVFGRLKGQKRF
jgi:hypothetical protein